MGAGAHPSIRPPASDNTFCPPAALYRVWLGTPATEPHLKFKLDILMQEVPHMVSRAHVGGAAAQAQRAPPYLPLAGLTALSITCVWCAPPPSLKPRRTGS